MCLILMWGQGPLKRVYSLKNQCTMTMTMLWFAPFLGGNQNSRKIRNAWLTWAMVRTHIYAHLQQMKVVNHIICVWYLCESPFEWVYSLNYPAIVFFPKGDRHWSLGNFQWLGECEHNNMARAHTYELPHHMSCETPFMCLVLMWKPT